MYREFSEFRGRVIDRMARQLRPDDLEEYHPIVEDESTLALLDEVWKAYSPFTAIQLSNKTHKPGTPWHKVNAKYDPDPIPRGVDIPQPLMQQYFSRVLSGEVVD